MPEHYCNEHGVKFFKTPKMKGYAHPIEGEEDENGKQSWCNEPKEETPSDTPAKSKSSPPKRDSSTNDSIEQQKAIMEIGEDWRAGKLDDKDSLVATYKNWIMSKLSYWSSMGNIEPEYESATKGFLGDKNPETKVEKPTEEQRKRLSSAINQYGTKEAKELLIERWQTNKTEHLSSEQMEDFIEQLTEEINDTIDLNDVPF